MYIYIRPFLDVLTPPKSSFLVFPSKSKPTSHNYTWRKHSKSCDIHSLLSRYNRLIYNIYTIQKILRVGKIQYTIYNIHNILTYNIHSEICNVQELKNRTLIVIAVIGYERVYQPNARTRSYLLLSNEENEYFRGLESGKIVREIHNPYSADESNTWIMLRPPIRVHADNMRACVEA